ncbi:MAG: glycerol-3-phosphate 1-O-acyltransferase PlsY [Alphaproteobacteria bacterium]|nr:glycerol-3-phosphate 1-O-acyltransferase PlsY [Alphaproteobacteria bacterium]
MMLAAVFVFAYLLGSIPFGLLLTRVAGLGDIRAIGSGNIGATNVLRTGNKKIAALTLFLDGLKGLAAVLIAQHVMPGPGAAIAAIGALLGHMFPVWLRFKGGKGVATGIGALLGLNGLAGIAVTLVWLIMAKRFRISSLAALVAFGTAPLWVIAFGRADLAMLVLAMAALIFLRHRANIRRLFLHTEPKIGHKDDPSPPPERD